MIETCLIEIPFIGGIAQPSRSDFRDVGTCVVLGVIDSEFINEAPFDEWEAYLDDSIYEEEL